MTGSKPPFRATDAVDVLGETEGDFVLPLCLPQPSLLVGEDLAVVVLDTIHGQRVGLPLSPQGVTDLHAVLGEALRLLQARDGGPVQ
ncbi:MULTISPECIES: hypothetical protein [Methylobacterium]|jgi:hypothetical protein|uniref:Uncharacterized protein n=1 Tax=Methylobacterium longum TaxID=767694 RepID=A0ABT8AQB9_9HYPH|nr:MULTISPECIES: hypothetical protein [Methylobacterium]MCJ2102189.1 hypothetical protein [Methylobacterium sp. E-046]MDN3571935.1 hypothetical protein [Methylobacterium longum]GJE10915.1 hypothetical protein FOHLNKBM_1952 [Methylobacterium longum]